MSFEFYDYIFPGVIVPIIFLILLFLPVMFLSKMLAKKKLGTAAILFPFIIGLVIFYGFLATAAEGLQPPLTLLFQSKDPPRITSGTITEIRKGAPLPLYFDSDTQTFHSAFWITVNDELYYLPQCPFEKGAQVKITWRTEARVVYKLEAASNNCEASVQGNAGIPQHQDTKLQQSGRLLARISSFLIVGIIFLQYLLGKKIANRLQIKDQCHTYGIIPNKIGLFHFAVTFLPFLGILVGLWLSGYHSAILIAAIAVLILTGITLVKQTTTVKLSEKKLIYRNFLHVKSYGFSEITEVTWRQSRIPGNRCLVIVLCNGSTLCFEQENFWGLQNTFEQIKKHLDNEKVNN